MKIPKATQLPSGSWRTRVRIDGKDITITRNTEEETVAEAMALKAGLQEAKNKAPKDMTLREAMDEYITMREPVLSPATIRGYITIRNNRLQTVMDRTINKTTDKMYQQAINADIKKCAPKTMKNAWGLISTVLEDVAGRKVECALPQVVSSERLFLEPEEILVFIDSVAGHKDEIPILVELHGLRISELLNLTWKDIDTKKKTITVHGSAVPDKDNNLVHKESNKTSASRRVVPILIPQLLEAVEKADKTTKYVYTHGSSTLYGSINRVCRKNGLPLVGNHGCRHSFASLCYSLKIPEQMTQKLGGWQDAGTMRKIYTHLASRDIQKHLGALADFFSK